MGIPGLLNQLKSLSRQVNLKEYQGLRIGIDIYCWLHRGGYSCCRDLAEGNETNAYVVFCMEMLHLMLSYSIKPVIVFDGRPLPAKQLLNISRKEFREKNKKLAQDAASIGDEKLAYKYYQKSVTVTYDMSRNLMKTLKKENIDFIVSPYESDAQLAFLSKNNLIDVVVTEDSDSLVYGCRRVLFKLDKEGNGMEIKRRNLGLNRDLSFLNWTDDQFKLMCCLAGCDYMPKLRNMGIKTAYKIVSQYSSLGTLLEHLEKSGLTRLYDNFAEVFEKCFLVFKHQTVYNPIKHRLQPLCPFPPFFPDGYLLANTRNDDADYSDPSSYLHFLGPMLPECSVRAVAEGTAHLFTLQSFQDISSCEVDTSSSTYQREVNDNMVSEIDDAEKEGAGRKESRAVGGDALITFQSGSKNNGKSKEVYEELAIAAAAFTSPKSLAHQRNAGTERRSTHKQLEKVVLQSIPKRLSTSASSIHLPIPVDSSVYQPSNDNHHTPDISPLRSGSPEYARDTSTMWAFIRDPKTSTAGLRSAEGRNREPFTASPTLTISNYKNNQKHMKKADHRARIKDDMFESPAVGDGLENLHRRKRRLHQTMGAPTDWDTGRVAVIAGRTIPATEKELGEATLGFVDGTDITKDLPHQSSLRTDIIKSWQPDDPTNTPRIILRQYLDSPLVANKSSGWGKSHLLSDSHDLSLPLDISSGYTHDLESVRSTGVGKLIGIPVKLSPDLDICHMEFDRENTTPNLENNDPAMIHLPSRQYDMLSIYPSFSNQNGQIPGCYKDSNNYTSFDDDGGGGDCGDSASCIPSFRKKILASQCRNEEWLHRHGERELTHDDQYLHRIRPPPAFRPLSSCRVDSPSYGIISATPSFSQMYHSKSPPLSTSSQHVDTNKLFNGYSLNFPTGNSSLNSGSIGNDLVTFRPNFSSFTTAKSHLSVPDSFHAKRGERYWDLELA